MTSPVRAETKPVLVHESDDPLMPIFAWWTQDMHLEKATANTKDGYTITAVHKDWTLSVTLTTDERKGKTPGEQVQVLVSRLAKVSGRAVPNTIAVADVDGV